MAMIWTFGTDEDNLILQVTAEEGEGGVTFSVEVLKGQAHVNALYWSNGNGTAAESSYSGFTNGDGTLYRSEHSVNMNGSGVVWDGGHLISLPGLRGSQPLGEGDGPISFTVSDVDIAEFPTLGVRATGTSTDEGSVKWVAQAEEPEQTEDPEVVEEAEVVPELNGEPALTFFPNQHGNSVKDVGFFSVTGTEETFTFGASAVDSSDAPVPGRGIEVDSAGSLSFGRGVNALDPGTYRVTVTATGSEGTIVETTFTVLLGDGAGNPGNAGPKGAADTMPSLLFVLDDLSGVNILLGRNGDDRMTGSEGSDVMLGGNHKDTIDGGGGNDVIWGGNGADSLIGGAGDDLFAFLRVGESKPAGFDTIADWGDGADRIHLAFIDANPANVGDDTFSWGGENSDVLANSITWYYDAAGDTTIIQGDTNSDASAAELKIVLLGNHALAAEDFVL